MMYDRKVLLDTMINNVKAFYLMGGSEGYENLVEWFDLIREIVVKMIDGSPLEAELKLEYHIQELSDLGIKIGEVSFLEDHNVQDTMSHLYVVVLYSKACDPNNPRYDFVLTKTTFTLIENEVNHDD